MTVVTETFGGSGALSGSWTHVVLNWKVTRSSGVAVNDGVGGSSVAVWSADTFLTSHYAQAKIIAASSGNYVSVQCRVQDSGGGNFSFYEYYTDCSGAYAIAKRVGTSWTDLGNVGVAPAVNDTIRLEAKWTGSQTDLGAYKNGTQQGATKTDAAVTGGKPGISLNPSSSVVTAELDDWEGGDLSTSISLTPPVGSLGLTKYAPTVNASGSASATPPTGTVIVTGLVPTIQIVGGALTKTDSFTGSGALSGWTNQWTGKYANVTRVSNVAQADAAGPAKAFWSADTFNVNHYSQAKIVAASTNNFVGVSVRAKNVYPSESSYEYFTDCSVANNIGRDNVFAWTDLGAVGGTMPAVGDTIRLEAWWDGSTTTLKAFRNGTLQGTPKTDNVITAGAPGITLNAASTPSAATLDDWQGGDLSSGQALSPPTPVLALTGLVPTVLGGAQTAMVQNIGRTGGRRG